jgi:cytoskeletal protein CcmA (bactofilin family)
MNDCTISGSGTISGGEYRNVRISGAGKVTGDLKCESFSCSGASNVEGSIVCSDFNCSGSTKVKGDLKSTGTVRISGSTIISGTVSAGEIRSSGSFHAENTVSANSSVSMSGSTRIDGDLIAENITISGLVKVSGLMNGGNVSICPSGNSRTGSIGGTNITIKNDSPNYFINFIAKFFSNSNSDFSFETDSIEGDKIEIFHTKAKLVRGGVVTIGDGCEVERVEYSESITYSDHCKIGEMVEI